VRRDLGEPHRPREQRLAAREAVDVRTRRLEPLDRELGRHLEGACDERRVRAVDDGKFEAQPLRIGEHQRTRLPVQVGHPFAAEPVDPEVERRLRCDAEHHTVHHAGAVLPCPSAGVFEEGEIGARRPVLVGVEQVVDRRIVLVDGLLDQSEPEHARVEVHVGRGVAGDGADVVDAFELHGGLRWILRRSQK
jgi:hypothetical protein